MGEWGTQGCWKERRSLGEAVKCGVQGLQVVFGLADPSPGSFPGPPAVVPDSDVAGSEFFFLFTGDLGYSPQLALSVVRAQQAGLLLQAVVRGHLQITQRLW